MVDATARRKWDKEEYARRARERLDAEERELNKDLGKGYIGTSTWAALYTALYT
jgi:hypothetical protein